MKIDGKEYQSLWFEGKKVNFIDQRKLPYTFEIFTATSIEDIAFAIRDMVVRGAPAIGAAAAYGMALGHTNPEKTATFLKATRPTAHDLFYAIDYMTQAINSGENAFDAATTYVETIVTRCKKIGENGEKLLKEAMTILTHCNAGALATVDYGTALAPIRIAHRKKRRMFIYADETRPRLQGLLTSWELFHEGIPHALIVDNAAGYLMEKGIIDLVIVGADRIAKNGDFANKIGTYEKAVCAKENNIPFYVAAPINTFDTIIPTGSQIIIEQRSRQELTTINEKTIMPDWVPVENPAFDITPHRYVTGYITEKGIQKR